MSKLSDMAVATTIVTGAKVYGYDPSETDPINRTKAFLISDISGLSTAGTAADNGDASKVLTIADKKTQRFDTLLTGNRIVTLPTDATSFNGSQFRIVRTGLGAFTLTVRDANLATIKILPISVAAFVDVEFTGTSWKISAYGLL